MIMNWFFDKLTLKRFQVQGKKSKLLSLYDEIECNKRKGAKRNWNITQE
jgi:hypothetical protein